MLFELACKLKELEELKDIRSSQNCEESSERNIYGLVGSEVPYFSGIRVNSG